MVTFTLMYCTSGILTADLSKYSLDNLAVSMMVMGLIFSLLISAATYLIYRMQRMLVITEFQNLLFASAMRDSTTFYAIISKASILYMDAPCAERVGKGWRKLNMEEFLTKIGLDRSQCYDCIRSLDQNKSFSVRCIIDEKELLITLAPLERPKGFFSIAAKELEYLKQSVES
ncbi:hypothetical protein [Neorickettsia helminthoeca]|nr:hypothetical protein [Neorickettsia helminthoeca]